MQTTLLSASAAPDRSARGPLRLAELHVLGPPYGDPQAAHALGEALRCLVRASPQGECLALEQPFSEHDPLPLGLNLWASWEALRNYVHRSGPTLRRWRLAGPSRRPVPTRVLWWTTQAPDLREGLLRWEALQRHGPGRIAFTLRSPYPAPASLPLP